MPQLIYPRWNLAPRPDCGSLSSRSSPHVNFLHPATNLKALLAARLRHPSVSLLKVSSAGSLQQKKRQRGEQRNSLLYGRAERAPLRVLYLREPEATVDEPQSNMKPKERFGL